MTQVTPLQLIQYSSVGQDQFHETEALYPMSSKTHYLGICRKNKGTIYICNTGILIYVLNASECDLPMI